MLEDKFGDFRVNVSESNKSNKNAKIEKEEGHIYKYINNKYNNDWK